jgi:DNA-binding transcriptional MerR regulator
MIAEVSERLGVPQGTLRDWERQFEGLLFIPRDERGMRYYTEVEIKILENIKAMREKRLSIPIIRDLLEQARTLTNEETDSDLPVAIQSKAVISQTEAIEVIRQQGEMIQVMARTLSQMIDEMNAIKSTVKQLQQGQLQIAATQIQHSEALSESVKGLALASETLAVLSEITKQTNDGIEVLKSRDKTHKKSSILMKIIASILRKHLNKPTKRDGSVSND